MSRRLLRPVRRRAGLRSVAVSATASLLTLFVLAIGVFALTHAVRSAGDGKAARRALYPSEFPAGAGHDLAGRSCLICHSASLVTQQAKDSTGWEKTLGQMEKWGVQLGRAEHDTLRRYLLAHYGSRTR